MSNEKHPAIVALLGIVPGLINTVTSVIRDKKKNDTDLCDPSKPTNIIDAVGKIEIGVKLSSKRMMNIAGTGTMFAIAAKDYLVYGLSWECVALFAVGAVYSGVMAWITHRSEK